VEHIAAYSPEARGRSERLFHTLQDRLIKELALARISTVEAANHFIRTVYIPDHNARFAVKAEQEGSAWNIDPLVLLSHKIGDSRFGAIWYLAESSISESECPWNAGAKQVKPLFWLMSIV
jgi:hypothetical protein